MSDIKEEKRKKKKEKRKKNAMRTFVCVSVFLFFVFYFFNASAWYRKLAQVILIICILNTPRPDYISQRPLLFSLTPTKINKALASDTTKR